jgi:hypothetical protein|tara:strand:- start:34 stop:426 length:393 start_codon:yes stop_codon:yes gene_type:complete
MIFVDNKGNLKVGRRKCKYHKKANVVQAAKKLLPESQLYKKVLKTTKELCADMKSSSKVGSMKRDYADSQYRIDSKGRPYITYRVDGKGPTFREYQAVSVKRKRSASPPTIRKSKRSTKGQGARRLIQSI